MFIYLLRHAWASHHGDPRWPDDWQRPLTPEGRARFAQMAQALVEQGTRPEVIATSPLVRCRQTAEILADCLAGAARVVEVEALTPGSDVGALIEWSRRQDANDLAWVGHAPDMGRMAAALIGSQRGNLRFAKGTCAAVRFHGAVELGMGDLHWLVTARVLGL